MLSFSLSFSTAWLFVQAAAGNYRGSLLSSLSTFYSRPQVVCFIHTMLRQSPIHVLLRIAQRFLKVLLGFPNW